MSKNKSQTQEIIEEQQQQQQQSTQPKQHSNLQQEEKSEPGKIVIALGRDPKNLKLKDDLDIIMLKNPAYLKKYNRNRSLLLMDLIRDLVKVNKQFL